MSCYCRYLTCALIIFWSAWWTTKAGGLWCNVTTGNNTRCGFGTEHNGSACACKDGFTRARLSNLTDICSCSMDCNGEDTKKAQCDYNSLCNKAGKCKCMRGFKRIDGLCEDINECASGAASPCDDHAQCNNTDGSFTCVCDAGYARNGQACTDLNECSTGESCGEHAYCVNTPGSFSCQCRSGYALDVNSTCTEIDECSLEHPVCDERARCENTLGSFECICDKGFILLNGNMCKDINECGKFPCNEYEICQNTEGSFSCECDNGYANNSSTCDDIDECVTTPLVCHENALCTNVPGSFRCACHQGYTGNGTVCQDVDECEAGLTCSDHMQCENTAGSFGCLCEHGYFLNVTSCYDRDECREGNHSCEEASNCVNTAGSHRCMCEGGFLEKWILCSGSLVIWITAVVGVVLLPVICVVAVRLLRKRRLSRNVTDNTLGMTVLSSKECERARDLPQHALSQQIWSATWNSRTQFLANDLYDSYDQSAFPTSTCKQAHGLLDSVTTSTNRTSTSLETFSSFSTLSDPSASPPMYANVVNNSNE